MIEPTQARRWQRELNAMLKAAATDDPDGFAVIVHLLDTARSQLPAAAEHLRDQGYSWQDLGQALGVTRSAAAQRFRTSRA